MISQGRGLGMVPSDIVLRIVEHMDTGTRGRFMAADKRIHALVTSYERSISKFRASTFILPPLGNILSSSSDHRHVLSKDTFGMIRELELRDNRIDRLLEECPRIFSLATPPWLPCLTPRQQDGLVMILKRAFYHCDRIADIAANPPCSLIPPEHYLAILDGLYGLPSAFLATTAEEFKFNPLTVLKARPKQIQYIQSLSLEDVGGIFILVNMLGYGLTCFCSRSSYERKTIIEECVLRHGTWFVWCRLLGDPSLGELAGAIISAGMAELRQWESGAFNTPPGLKMTLMARFRELLGPSTANETNYKMEQALKRLVIGKELGRTGQEPDPDINK